MRIHVKLGVLFFAGLALGCSASRNNISEETMQKFEETVQGKAFEFEAEWAMPMNTNAINQLNNAGLFPPGSTAGMINLIGNTNHMKIKNDSVSAYLPYYGERQLGGGYNQNKTGIQFDGIPEDFKIKKDEKSNAYFVNFTIAEKTENYQVAMRIFPNLNANVNVNSNQRFNISYKGQVKAIEAME